MVLLAKTKTKTFFSKSGKRKTIRDTYSTPTRSWFDTVKRVQAMDNNACVSCGTTTGPLHTHHIKPLSKGGLTIPSNLVTLCLACHQKRHKHKLKPHA